VRLFDAGLTPGAASAAPGTVLAVADGGIDIALTGGVLHAKRLQLEGGKKLPAGELAAATDLAPGDAFEDGVAASA
jgi:methionyl-tRNA formyltransferase